MSAIPAWRATLPACLLALAACPTPLSNKIDIGEDAFVIGVGEGADGMTDLFAAPAGGGGFVRLTFTSPEERLPRLAPSGTQVAFFRRRTASPDAAWTVVVLDLRSNAERSLELPADAGLPEALGWSADGDSIAVRASRLLLIATHGGRALDSVPEPGRSRADSLTRELLGDPPVAMVRPCGGGGLCIVAADGETSALQPDAREATRWGADSVGYFVPAGYEVRPLAGGRARRPAWNGAPNHLRQLTFHGGSRPNPQQGPPGIP